MGLLSAPLHWLLSFLYEFPGGRGLYVEIFKLHPSLLQGTENQYIITHKCLGNQFSYFIQTEEACIRFPFLAYLSPLALCNSFPIFFLFPPFFPLILAIHAWGKWRMNVKLIREIIWLILLHDCSSKDLEVWRNIGWSLEAICWEMAAPLFFQLTLFCCRHQADSCKVKWRMLGKCWPQQVYHCKLLIILKQLF